MALSTSLGGTKLILKRRKSITLEILKITNSSVEQEELEKLTKGDCSIEIVNMKVFQCGSTRRTFWVQIGLDSISMERFVT